MAFSVDVRYAPIVSPTMTRAEILLVKQSFPAIAAVAAQAAGLFYARLFEIDPSLRQLFNGQITDQGRKLMDMLGFAVGQIDQPDLLLPALRQLGARHVQYQVRENHYATVGEALLWTLRQGLGAGFTPEVEQAWRALYTLIAETMKAGARAQAA